MSAITKLSKSTIRHQEASVKHREDMDNNHLKSWKKLLKIQQNVLLLGGFDEDGYIIEDVTDEILSFIGCSNKAQVEQYLKQYMPGLWSQWPSF